MITFPNAKINIGLNIIEKRKDGFHNIETFFFPIGWKDILEINTSDSGFKFTNTGIKVDDGEFEKNLCYKAYQLLKADFDIPGINMHLHKNIPFGAGLGGGSSDAAFVFKLLNDLYKLNLSQNQLMNYTRKIGSDCSFFILNKPAFATGKGDILNLADFKLKNKTIVVVHPSIHVNTANAYTQIKPKKTEFSLQEAIKKPIHIWKNFITNDFEEIIFKQHPGIAQLKAKLYQKGALYSAMSGSGSAVFGIFEKNAEPNLNEFNFNAWKGEII